MNLSAVFVCVVLCVALLAIPPVWCGIVASFIGLRKIRHAPRSAARVATSPACFGRRSVAVIRRATAREHHRHGCKPSASRGPGSDSGSLDVCDDRHALAWTLSRSEEQ